MQTSWSMNYSPWSLLIQGEHTRRYREERDGRLDKHTHMSFLFSKCENKLGLTKYRLMVWTLTRSTIQGQQVDKKVGRSLRELGCLIHLVILSYLGLGLAILKGKAVIPRAEHGFTRHNSWGWATNGSEVPWSGLSLAFSLPSSVTSNYYLHEEI